MVSPSSQPTHAIVIGASVAGLAAARVLTEHFDRVTILEKDELRDDATLRRGVPQARHVHALMIGGQRVLESLFPGFSAWMLDQGAVAANVGRDGAWYLMGAFRPKYDSALAPLCASRPLLEQGIRRFALQHERITLRGGVALAGYLADERRERVTGVQYTVAGDETIQTLEASFVVDATGRASRTPQFLQALGLTAPDEVTVTSRAAYATRVIRLRADPGWKLCYVQPSAPGGTRGGIIAPIEGGRAIVTLIGMSGDAPPTQEPGFSAFAASLPTPEINLALRDAEVLSPIYGYGTAENRLRRYDAMPRHLDGLVALGDAVYALNPVYGQGMTVAALGARTLGEVLRAATGRSGLQMQGISRRFQVALSKVIALPWQMATGEDLRWPLPENAGRIGLAGRMLNAYVDRVQRASLTSPALCEAFYRVAQMLDAPTALFRPAAVWGVIQDAWRPRPRAAIAIAAQNPA